MRDRVLECSYRFEIWQAPQQQYLRLKSGRFAGSTPMYSAMPLQLARCKHQDVINQLPPRPPPPTPTPQTWHTLCCLLSCFNYSSSGDVTLNDMRQQNTWKQWKMTHLKQTNKNDGSRCGYRQGWRLDLMEMLHKRVAFNFLFNIGYTNIAHFLYFTRFSILLIFVLMVPIQSHSIISPNVQLWTKCKCTAVTAMLYLSMTNTWTVYVQHGISDDILLIVIIWY